MFKAIIRWLTNLHAEVWEDRRVWLSVLFELIFWLAVFAAMAIMAIAGAHWVTK